MIVWIDIKTMPVPQDGQTYLLWDGFGALAGRWDDEEDYDPKEYPPGWCFYEIGGTDHIIECTPTHWARIDGPAR